MPGDFEIKETCEGAFQGPASVLKRHWSREVETEDSWEEMGRQSREEAVGGGAVPFVREAFPRQSPWHFVLKAF